MHADMTGDYSLWGERTQMAGGAGCDRQELVLLRACRLVVAYPVGQELAPAIEAGDSSKLLSNTIGP